MMFTLMVVFGLAMSTILAADRMFVGFPYRTDQNDIIHNIEMYDNHFCIKESASCRLRQVARGNCAFSVKTGCMYEPYYNFNLLAELIPEDRMTTDSPSTTVTTVATEDDDDTITIDDDTRLKFPFQWGGKTFHNRIMFDGYNCPYNATYNDVEHRFEKFCLHNTSVLNWPGRCVQIKTSNDTSCKFFTTSFPKD